MGTLSQSVEYDFETGLVTIRARGDLSILDASTLRTMTLKWLAEHPLCVIIDLTGIELRDEVPVLVLPALARRRDAAPIFVVADPLTSAGRVIDRALGGRLAVFKDEASAVEAASGQSVSRRRLHLHMPREVGAPARARELVGQACKMWGLPQLAGAAQVIISELVTNAVKHARTDMVATVALVEQHLHLQVRDRDPRIPRIFTADSPHPDHSRGMKLVDGLASGWGTTLRPYGKSVWATLKLA